MSLSSSGKKGIDAAAKAVFMLSAAFSIIAVLLIFVFLFYEGVPAINKIGLSDFIFGRKWRPSTYDTYSSPAAGEYGVFNMIVGSLAGTAGAVLIGGSAGFFTAVFISKFCKKTFKKILSHLVNLLAGIPSVVYGFFGLRILLPAIGIFSDNGSGSGIAAVSIVLGVMIIPTVAALSASSLDAVPEAYVEGALALGAKYNKAVFTVAVPAASSGINASLVLGIGRAIGETMAVIMVAGNSPVIPRDLFSSFRTLTGNIVLEMGYAGELQMGALVATGCVLFIFILIVNTVFNIIKSAGENKARKYERAARGNDVSGEAKKRPINKIRLSIDGERYNKLKTAILSKLPDAGKIMSIIAAAFASVALVSIIVFIFIRGIPNLSVDFLTADFKYGGPQTIYPSIVATLMLVFVSVLIAVPLGISSAIYLNEYAARTKLMRLIRLALETLGGIPSIIYGLFGMILFSGILKLGTSIIAGALTVSLMIIPVTVRATEESLKSVPSALREGSYALGAGKARTIFKVVVPPALPGIVSAVILGISRVVSETAPLIFTMGASLKPAPKGFASGGTTLAVALYKLAGEGLHVGEAYAAATILVLFVLILNTLSAFLGERLGRKLKGD
jgi:phosphate ABC transporter, permease protein PstA/phosphate ABC transporter, permease protein PstC